MTPSRLFALLAVLAVFAAGCGDDNDKSDKSATSETPAAATEAEEEPAAKTGGAVAVSNAKDLKSKPKLAKPEGDPPTELVVKDLVVGKGPAAESGDTVSVQYVGVSWSTGQQFDASWDRGAQPFTFPLGGGQVIAGWDEGVAGMKAGGRRELVIPPDKGYGPQGAPPDIAPNETLVFVVDLKRIG